jgi:hypothetical protein
MIETYKILNNIDKVQYEQILPLGVTARNYIKSLEYGLFSPLDPS